MTKYCLIYHVKKQFVIMNLFTVNKGPLKCGKAIIASDEDNSSHIGAIVLEALNSFEELNHEFIDRSHFFYDNLKQYGYKSERDFHKKTDFSLCILLDNNKVTIIPTEKDKLGYSHKPEKSLDCMADEKEITHAIRTMYGISKDVS